MKSSPSTLFSSITFNLLLSYKRQARFSGWRGGFVLAIIGSSLVLLFNIICAIVAAAAGKPHDGIATIYTGNCVLASRLTTGLQLLINILSSSLLGASSYCLQRLVAPTREEIDKAHKQGKSLDLGVLSLRNLPNISRRRLAVWLLLATSSLPLHFLYNSVIFQTTATNSVDIAMITESFLTTRGGWELRDVDNKYRPYFQALQDTFLDKQNPSASLFEKIPAVKCIHRYQTTFIRAGNGFAVMATDYSGVKGETIDSSSLLAIGMNTTEMWFGPEFASHLLYCLSEDSPERCQVQLNQSILYVVIACSVLKVTLMLMVLWGMNHETIVTIGDAIETFILKPDSSTQDCCLVDGHSIEQALRISARRIHRYQPINQKHWYRAVSRKRWFCSLSLYFLVIATAAYLYSRMGSRLVKCMTWDASGIKVDHVCRWNGFGNVNYRWILDVYLGSTSLIPYVLLANTPQVLISFLYLTYNGLFTSMLANREWASYTHKRAALRVTVPKSTQRSTYFLSLPYKYSLPLIIVSILLHWFVSQTLFIAPIAVYKNDILKPRPGRWWYRDGTSGTGLGFSDSALVAAIVMGCLLIVVCLAFAGCCKYPTGMPLGGTNSAVISAACHVKNRNGRKAEGLDDIVERPLKWGVTIEGTKDQAGHCSFSDKAVQKPVEGCLYA